jgi:hypothetical protein
LINAVMHVIRQEQAAQRLAMGREVAEGHAYGREVAEGYA